MYDVNDLSHVTTLETTADTAPALVTHDDNNLPRSCKIVLHNRTLAVNSKSRTKVRLYSTILISDWLTQTILTSVWFSGETV